MWSVVLVCAVVHLWYMCCVVFALKDNTEWLTSRSRCWSKICTRCFKKEDKNRLEFSFLFSISLREHMYVALWYKNCCHQPNLRLEYFVFNLKFFRGSSSILIKKRLIDLHYNQPRQGPFKMFYYKLLFDGNTHSKGYFLYYIYYCYKQPAS